jgi:hypothetical protein
MRQSRRVTAPGSWSVLSGAALDGERIGLLRTPEDDDLIEPLRVQLSDGTAQQP